jgi:hypothetical protein
VSPEVIARLADQGKDVSHFFKGHQVASDLNVSRQAVIKTLVRQALDQHNLAQRATQP